MSYAIATFCYGERYYNQTNRMIESFKNFEEKPKIFIVTDKPDSIIKEDFVFVSNIKEIDFCVVGFENFNQFKNIIGTINQPKGVFINTKFLKTLSQRQLKNGLAEIYKIALVNSHTFWNELSSFSEKTSYIKLITKSIQIKNKIILKDPFDKGIRKSLNFGHTIGHAIESEFLNSEAPMLHGEAVLIGLLIESKISYQKQLISKPMLLEIYSVLTSHFKLRSISEIPISSIINRIKNDKKASKNILLFSLINGIGSFKIDVIVSETQIQKAITDHNNLIR